MLEPRSHLTTYVNEYFKSISHHHINNAFHDLNFGSNANNIHLASPGECLHMHQLGCAKRAVQSLLELLLRGKVNCVYAPNLRTGIPTVNAFGHLAQQYGALLS